MLGSSWIGLDSGGVGPRDEPYTRNSIRSILIYYKIKKWNSFVAPGPMLQSHSHGIEFYIDLFLVLIAGKW